MKLIHQEEEKKKERELTLAADSVLCEVRKKQADIKRMQEVFRSLEKLRKLRKEAALRKGILTEQQSEETFNSQLEKMRSVMRKRTATYSAEEKALMVMLEGAQEEERRRDMEKKLKNERDRRLQMKHKVDSMLFGDETPADPDLQPFREYYTQAQRTLHALVQIRRDWDVFLVAAYHPDGTSVPQDWVLPDPPADQTTEQTQTLRKLQLQDVTVMDGVPLKTPEAASGEVADTDIIIPDYLLILQETEYEFSLEKWVLTGLQGGFTHQPQGSSCSVGVAASSPPYWMMFSSPQQSRLASRHDSDFWEPQPQTALQQPEPCSPVPKVQHLTL
ncbi:unnamed protein product [Lampetra planeri]